MNDIQNIVAEMREQMRGGAGVWNATIGSWADRLSRLSQPMSSEPVAWPSEAQLLAFGIEEEHMLCCDPESYAQMALEILAKFGRKLPAAPAPSVVVTDEMVFAAWDTLGQLGIVTMPTHVKAAIEAALGKPRRGV